MFQRTVSSAVQRSGRSLVPRCLIGRSGLCALVACDHESADGRDRRKPQSNLWWFKAKPGRGASPRRGFATPFAGVAHDALDRGASKGSSPTINSARGCALSQSHLHGRRTNFGFPHGRRRDEFCAINTGAQWAYSVRRRSSTWRHRALCLNRREIVSTSARTRRPSGANSQSYRQRLVRNARQALSHPI
jgi:hypothetical protein